jgi:hypothetical protein
MKQTPKREKRLNSAKTWIKTYPGKNPVKGYSKKYGVDKLCAVKELRMIGVNISETYEKQLIHSLEALKKQRLAIKKKREEALKIDPPFDSDEHHAMIMGYTSGGFAYGVTHEEMEKIEKAKHQSENDEFLSESDFDEEMKKWLE